MENHQVISSKFENICVKAASGNIDESEKRQLDKWLASSDDHLKFYNEIKSLWQEVLPSAVPEIRPAEAGWLEMEKMIQEETREKQPNPVKSYNIISRFADTLNTQWLRPAFVAVCVIIVAVGGWKIFIAESEDAALQRIITQNSQKTEMMLADGSTVTLNSGSTVTYDRNFNNKNREVILDGEAFFKITHNGLPFTVVTENARTTVLGTEFNVRAREGKTRVIVVNGCVRLESDTQADAENKNVILTKDQMSEIIGHTEPVSPTVVDAEASLGWLVGRLVFQKTPLIEILGELERFYDVNIVLEDSSLSQRTITAAFNQASFETVLSSICLTLGVRYQNDQDEYRILE